MSVFDTVDISTIMRRLESSFSIFGAGLAWIKSYLTNRSRFVKVGKARRPSELYNFGVPQGSFHGSLIFAFYVAPICNVTTSLGVVFYQYVDDTQLYIAMEKSNVDAKLRSVCVRFMIGSAERICTQS